MSEEKQAVADEADVDATPSTEDSSAQEKTVDELLAEFENEKDEPKVESKPSSEKGVKLDESERKRIKEDLRSEMEIEAELEKTIVDIKGDLPVESEYIRWKLNEMAMKDSRIWKAFLAKNKNPDAWKGIVKSLKGDLAKTYGRAENTDKEKIASAVRSATQATGTSQDVKDIKKMSDEEFEMSKEKLLQQAMKG